MTLLASWVAVDSRKPSAMYIVSDSRITWEKKGKYEYGRKVFASISTPNIFGYCGDVLFPTIVLNQIITLIDAGAFFSREWNYQKKLKLLSNISRRLLSITLQNPLLELCKIV